MSRLDRKSARVPGAGFGTGDAVAPCFAGQGARARVADRDEPREAQLPALDAIEAYAYPAGAVWKNLASAPPGRAL
jgi:NAD(P)-dependent dehydrogenase (short-subunit alcohol dehydrogenase family)